MPQCVQCIFLYKVFCPEFSMRSNCENNWPFIFLLLFFNYFSCNRYLLEYWWRMKRALGKCATSWQTITSTCPKNPTAPHSSSPYTVMVSVASEVMMPLFRGVTRSLLGTDSRALFHQSRSGTVVSCRWRCVCVFMWLTVVDIFFKIFNLPLLPRTGVTSIWDSVIAAKWRIYFDRLLQERHISSALAMEICLSCTNPANYGNYCTIFGNLNCKMTAILLCPNGLRHLYICCLSFLGTYG